MREKFRQFMIGRYGTDGLNQFLSMSSIVMLLVSLLTRVSLFTWLGAALLILCYYRSLSRNISKRTEENYRFYSLKDRFNNKFRSLKEQWANRKLYHYYRCPPGDADASRSPAPAAAPSSSKRAELPCSDM